MSGYFLIIGVVSILLSVLNGLWIAPIYGFHPWTAVGLTLITAIVAVALNALFALVIRHCLPEKFFVRKETKLNRFLFGVKKREKDFYETIKIRKWKDKIPEVGEQTTGFSKNKIVRPSDNGYLNTYFTEVHYGETIHFLCVLLGIGFPFLAYLYRALFSAPMIFAWTIGLPVALLDIALNLPSLFILRYNSYKLEVLFKANEQKEKLASVKNKSELEQEAATAE